MIENDVELFSTKADFVLFVMLFGAVCLVMGVILFLIFTILVIAEVKSVSFLLGPGAVILVGTVLYPIAYVWSKKIMQDHNSEE